MTGIVGVNGDILGTGLGARPIANTDVFCWPSKLWKNTKGLFHPSEYSVACMQESEPVETNLEYPQ